MQEGDQSDERIVLETNSKRVETSKGFGKNASAPASSAAFSAVG